MIRQLVISLVVMTLCNNVRNLLVEAECESVSNCTTCQPHGPAQCKNICPAKVALPLDMTELKLTEVSCIYMRIGMIRPEDFGSYTSLEKVDLSNNHIKSLYFAPPKFSPTFMNMPNVKVLSLAYNQLYSVNQKIFAKLSRLEELDLSNNAIQAIYFNNSAERWPLIKVLKLNNNNIKVIAASTLAAVSKAETLVLSYNPITSIDSEAFKPLTNLHTIEIEGLPLTEVPAAIFVNPQTLKEVVASNMTVSTLPDNILHGTSLDKLDLSHDQFTSIPTTAIKNCAKQPRLLDLSHNKISQISATDLQGLTVQTLDLSGNPIVQVDDKAFDGSTLSQIDLSNTGLTSLPATMETWLRSTTAAVNLDNTNWLCTCDTIWLARVVDQKTNITPPKCAVGGKYGGTSLKDALTQMETDCATTTTTTTTTSTTPTTTTTSTTTKPTTTTMPTTTSPTTTISTPTKATTQTTTTSTTRSTTEPTQRPANRAVAPAYNSDLVGVMFIVLAVMCTSVLCLAVAGIIAGCYFCQATNKVKSYHQEEPPFKLI